MSYSVRFLSAVVAALLVAGCDRKPPPAASAGEGGVRRPQVTVLNADILVVDGRHIRLFNAFAPQPVPDARCWAEALAAKQATRTVQAMVQRAAVIEVVPTGAVDDFNRTLAEVRLDGADLGQVLFEEGLGARPAKGRFEWCNPLSRNDPGAPTLWSMIELAPGRAPGE